MNLPFSPSRLCLSLAALGGALAFPSTFAASLGDIDVQSALGERLQASIPVVANGDEMLSIRCFRLLPGTDEGAAHLTRARLAFDGTPDGGTLRIFSIDAVQEPVIGVSVRVACPTSSTGEFQRDYSLLLDPREYTAAPVVSPRRSAATRRASDESRRAVPALGGIWRTESGDSVERIARRYFPSDAQERAWLIDQIHAMNDGLPQSSRTPLERDLAIYLPAPRIRPQEPEDVVSQVLPREPVRPATKPALTIEPLPPAVGSVAPDTPRPTEADGTYRLQLSAPTLDLEYRAPMTPEETLRLRENLLLLESDDQTAQLMQLKYQIAQLEKQLAQIKSRAGLKSGAEPQTGRTEKPVVSSEGGYWMWGGLLALLLLPGGYLLWRWRERRLAEEYEPFSMATTLEPRFGATGKLVTGFGEGPVPVAGAVTGGAGASVRDLAHNIAQMANEWHNDEVDVVLPGNVSEEAQLLIDHGLVQQAVNLLSHEIEQHPTALALWMKLFEVLRHNDMKQPYQERAVAFRLQFASDALWQQVQALGRDLDPGNPLYEPLDDEEGLLQATARPVPPPPVQPEKPPVSMPAATPLRDALGPRDDEPMMSVEMPSLEFILPPAVEPEPPSNIIETLELPALDSEPFELEATPAQEPPPAEGEPLFKPADFLIAEVAPSEKPATTEVNPTEFLTDDPVLRPVSELLAKGDTGTVFRLLEETLYNGTLEQRQTALKWLDRLFPIKHR
ncbi:type IV pilus assembly protein FimV [Chitiniphilus eburneus]|uniref:FimV N-terminal domain-containing protein n=1 Tax=Chitiniphilus eburneus TaxID=2571148 RepID=A0A4U0Q377_9NEIS|nr:hypothetical protein [Chitiniphilus eburneus]TJZ75507.1 hypothetical protein FAZ21_06225 [Chitiniphilus eburneus]